MGGGGGRGRGQGGCERRIEVFVKIQKKKYFFFFFGGGGGSVGGVGLGGGVRVDVNEIEKQFGGYRGGGLGGGRVRGQSGCERRIDVIVKIQKQNFFLGGGWGGGGRGRVGGTGWM